MFSPLYLEDTSWKVRPELGRAVGNVPAQTPSDIGLTNAASGTSKRLQYISRSIRGLVFCLAMSLFASCSFAELPEQIVLRHLATFPHDRTAFTQGLLWDNGFLYESAGQYGESSLRKVEPKTGKVVARVDLPRQFFAEGLALVDDSLFQLTWRENICFVYDKETFQLKNRFQYPGEGWGLTYDGKHLILSDGTHTLRFLDPKTFRVQRTINVLDSIQKRRPEPVRYLNELEWVRGEVWANVWMTTRIVRINPKNGSVIGWIEMSPFVPEEHRNDMQHCVLNGIAFDPATNHIYITGKYWNVMHQFQLAVPEKK
jgi:glutaminyl-peptide cyclotransferase